METVGWAGAVVLALGGAVWILGYLFDQIPPLCDKAINAIRAVRALREEYARASGAGRPPDRGGDGEHPPRPAVRPRGPRTEGGGDRPGATRAGAAAEDRAPAYRRPPGDATMRQDRRRRAEEDAVEASGDGSMTGAASGGDD